jgi:N-acyl amino acid synthase of PEP-CTERM/exosortase system
VYIETPFALGAPNFRESSPDFVPADNSLLTRFNAHFRTFTANTPEQIREAQTIRYQVYCIENSLEYPNPEGIESDCFDSHSVHSLLIYRAAGKALGTVRLIMPLADEAEHCFPMQQVLPAAVVREFRKLPLDSAAEVSRFSISRQFRRMAEGSNEEQAEFVSVSGPLMRLGLIQSLVRMSFEYGITHWCAMMEPTLLRMLAAMAIRFRPIGPLIEFHGLRQPCYCNLADILQAVRRERPAFWSVLTNGGALLESAVAA